jgi:hypothetical protein
MHVSLMAVTCSDGEAMYSDPVTPHDERGTRSRSKP